MKSIALCGYAFAGKDEVAAILCQRYDYRRVAFGDIIKRRVRDEFAAAAFLPQVHRLLDWLEHNGRERDRLDAVYQSAMVMRERRIDPTIAMGDAKARLRPLLEEYGEWHYDEVFRKFFAKLPPMAVNSQICRVREAREWIRLGGEIWRVDRPGIECETPWKAEQMADLERAGCICRTIRNDGPADSWRDVLADHVATTLSEPKNSPLQRR